MVARLGAAAAGEVRPWRRGGLAWRMAMPPARGEGRGLVPALIQWDDGQGAAPRVPDSGVRLTALDVEHPEPDAIRGSLAARGLEEAVRLRRGAHPRLVAHFARGDGTETALVG